MPQVSCPGFSQVHFPRSTGVIVRIFHPPNYLLILALNGMLQRYMWAATEPTYPISGKCLVGGSMGKYKSKFRSASRPWTKSPGFWHRANTTILCSRPRSMVSRDHIMSTVDEYMISPQVEGEKSSIELKGRDGWKQPFAHLPLLLQGRDLGYKIRYNCHGLHPSCEPKVSSSSCILPTARQRTCRSPPPLLRLRLLCRELVHCPPKGALRKTRLARI